MLGQPGAKRLHACGHGLLLHRRTWVGLGRCLLPCILQGVGQRRLEVDEGDRRDGRGILRRRAPVSLRHHPALREHRCRCSAGELLNLLRRHRPAAAPRLALNRDV